MRSSRIVFFLLFFAILATGPVAAQQTAQQSKEAVAPGPKLEGRVFELEHASARALLPILQPLTSGVPGAMLTGSDEARAISVRDLPENLDAISVAISSLDRPASEAPPVALEVRISLIAASQDAPESSPAFPPSLAPVVEQLRRTMNFKHYRYITTLSQRAVDYGPVGASGPTANIFPMKGVNKPAFYEYRLQNLRLLGTGAEATIRVGAFEFIASLPVVTNLSAFKVGVASPSIEYQKLSMQTGLSLREGEQVVVGTTGIDEGDKALIVVISISRAKM